MKKTACLFLLTLLLSSNALAIEIKADLIVVNANVRTMDKSHPAAQAFAVLSDDIFTINPVEIRNTKVLTTVVDGKIVYQAK